MAKKQENKDLSSRMAILISSLKQEVSTERKTWSAHCSVMSSSASQTRFNLLTPSLSARYVTNDSFAKVKCACFERTEKSFALSS